MKVLQINSVCGIGSTGRIATDIHNILIDQGHESYIAYGRDLPKNCDNAISIGTKIDNYTHVAKTRIFDKHGFGSKQATIEFIKKVKELDPDIIHLHNIHGYYINIEILFDYLKEANKPVVWTLHDCWAFTGHCSHFDYINCNSWKTGCNHCPQKDRYPKSLFVDNSDFNYQKKKQLFTSINNITIVTPSKWLSNKVKMSFLNKYNIKVIYNGIDLKIFNPIDRKIFRERFSLKDKFIILGVASIWNDRKGLEYFHELSKYIDKDSIIVIVGLNDKQLKKLPQNILGIKRTNKIEELAEIYSSADVFVNPTLEEVLGLVNLEALACGTPVITFNTGGSVECIDNSSGVVVEKGNMDHLFSAISNYKNKIYRRSNDVSQYLHYDKQKRYMEYLNCYYELTGRA